MIQYARTNCQILYSILLMEIMMRNLKKIILIILSFALLSACTNSDDQSGNEDKAEADKIGDSVTMRAEIVELGDRLMVNVLESEYTSGPHVVHTPPETRLLDKDGNKITLDELKIGDTVDIRYGGQVMMSYPPQIVAAEIRLVGDN
ncbi:MAG: hypothetical protein E7617_03370 [Ruminococcaceae bacterium]|nr:hypothetical protein [Oscillospiraceae bacterium]